MRLKFFLPAVLFLLSAGCVLITAPYDVTKGAVNGSVWVVKTGYTVTAAGTKTVYRIGKFTYEVVKAPLEWPLTHDFQEIDGLPPKEAIRLGRVKNFPYTVRGRRYLPMSVEKAEHYRETGIASWYGYETRRRSGGHMTADGEAFEPSGLTAAHKYLPLPMYVRVVNLENGRSVIVRVNDRGPFPCDENPEAGKRIIDLSMGAAKKLGMYDQGTAMVRVEAARVREE
ncbi:MAG: septal ring lytic transglycosylase RlpA family protein [Candidatus Sulfobium sp.]|jgi:rare lipoprotein A